MPARKTADQEHSITYSYDRPFPGDFQAEHPDLVVDLVDLAEGYGVEELLGASVLSVNT